MGIKRVGRWAIGLVMVLILMQFVLPWWYSKQFRANLYQQWPDSGQIEVRITAIPAFNLFFNKAERIIITGRDVRFDGFLVETLWVELDSVRFAVNGDAESFSFSRGMSTFSIRDVAMAEYLTKQLHDIDTVVIVIDDGQIKGTAYYRYMDIRIPFSFAGVFAIDQQRGLEFVLLDMSLLGLTVPGWMFQYMGTMFSTNNLNQAFNLMDASYEVIEVEMDDGSIMIKVLLKPI